MSLLCYHSDTSHSTAREHLQRRLEPETGLGHGAGAGRAPEQHRALPTAPCPPHSTVPLPTARPPSPAPRRACACSQTIPTPPQLTFAPSQSLFCSFADLISSQLWRYLGTKSPLIKPPLSLLSEKGDIRSSSIPHYGAFCSLPVPAVPSAACRLWVPAAGCTPPPHHHHHCRGFIPCLGAASLPAGRHGGISGHKAKHCKKEQESHQPCARSGTEAALRPSPALCRHRKPQRAEPLGGGCPGTPVAAALCLPSPARWAALGTGQAPCSLSRAQHRVAGRALREPDPFSRALSHPGITGRRLQAFLSTGKQGTLL